MRETTHTKTIPLEGGSLDCALLYPLEYQNVLKFKYLEKGYLAFWGISRELGLMDARGRVILSPEWEDIRLQVDPGVIYATKNGRTILMDLSGKPLLDKSVAELLALGRGVAVLGLEKELLILDQLGAFFDGLARGRQGSTTYHVSPKGRALLRCRTGQLGDFHDGMALYLPKTKLFQKKRVGYCNKQGKLVIPATYSDAENFSGGFAAVQDETGWHYIRTDGTKLECYQTLNGNRLPLPPLRELSPFRGGYAPVLYLGKSRVAPGPDGFPLTLQEEMGGWGILHESGELTVPFRYNELTPTPEEGVFICSSHVPEGQEKRYGLINARGEVLLEEKYRLLAPLEKDLYAFILNRGIGVISKNGRVILEPVWDSISKSCGRAINVKRNDRWGLMDYRGDILLSAVYSNQIIHTAGLSVADREGEAKLLNRWGKSAIAEDILIRQCVEAGLLWVRENGKNYLLDYGFQP